jgi:hypothetical protein
MARGRAAADSAAVPRHSGRAQREANGRILRVCHRWWAEAEVCRNRGTSLASTRPSSTTGAPQTAASCQLPAASCQLPAAKQLPDRCHTAATPLPAAGAAYPRCPFSGHGAATGSGRRWMRS